MLQWKKYKTTWCLEGFDQRCWKSSRGRLDECSIQSLWYILDSVWSWLLWQTPDLKQQRHLSPSFPQRMNAPKKNLKNS
jgi:hypothetical protein